VFLSAVRARRRCAQLRLQEQLAGVERETGAVAAALDALRPPRGGRDADDAAAAEASAPDASLRLAVGRTRLAGLHARREALTAALAAARAADAAAAEEAAAAARAHAASAAAAHTAVPPPPPRRPPSPRRAVLRDDDDFDAALGPIRGARRPTGAPRGSASGAARGGGGPNDPSAAPSGGAFVETERDRLIRRGVLTPFAALDGFERRLQTSVAKTVASARAAAAARPRTMLVDPAQLPRQHATPRDYLTPSASAQRCARARRPIRAG
jgi:DNA excision repair protein ERCC-6